MDNEPGNTGEKVDASISSPNPNAQFTSRGKKLTSNVWENMTRTAKDDGTVKATCNHCKKVFDANPNYGTSHLLRHVKACSAIRYRDMKSFCISAGGSNNNSVPMNQMSLRKPSFNLEDVRTALCQYVVSGGHPFSAVEEPGFKNLMRVTSPEFTLVSRYTVKRDTMEQYNVEKKAVCAELQNAPGRISFTTDNWRSENTWNEYMCVTAHWIDKDWKLQKRMIKFSSLDPPFDGASLADEILLCLGEWKISEKVFTFTLDNASYNDTMIASLKSHLLRKHSLVLHGEFFHMRCCCHIINLVVQAGLRVVDDVVVKIRKIVINLRNSIPKRKKFYEIACTNFGLNSTKRLRLDVCTRWNSTFTMLDRFLYFQEAVDSFVSKDLELRVHRLSLVEWEKVRELHEFLQAFYDTTNDFSASNTPTANVYFNGVWTIHTLLTKCAEGPVTVLSPMVIEMQAKFEKYWTDYNLLLSCAAVLDPRHKFEGVRYCYANLFGDVFAKEMMGKIKEVLSDLLDEYRLTDVAETNDIEVVQKVSNDSARRVSNSTMNPRAGLFDHLNKRKKTGKPNLKSELELYFEFDDDSFSATDDIDILEFLKENSRRLPTLAALARDILCIPISSVPSESAFSLGKKLIRATRSSLASTTIEALSCYEDWLRARGFMLGSSKILKIGDEGSEDIKDGDDEEKE